MAFQQFRPLTPEASPTLHDLSSSCRIYLWGCRILAAGLDPARWLSEATATLGDQRAVLLLCHLTILIRLVARHAKRPLPLNPSCAAPLTETEKALLGVVQTQDPLLVGVQWEYLVGTACPAALKSVAAEVGLILSEKGPMAA